MHNWTIRKAEATDATGLADCIDHAYSIYAQRLSDLPAVSGNISEEIENNLVWVAVVNRQIVGGVVLIPGSDHVLLANVAVRPNSIGQGLGRAFLDLAEAETRQLGLTKLRLTTHSAMTENVELYQHLGWVETGCSGSKVSMEKVLGP